MPYFARDSGVIVKCSEITDYGKSEQNPASCYYLLVVKLVVKGKGCEGYTKDSFRVFYKGKKIDGATASSFVVLDNGYAKDNFSTYYKGNKI